jgi:hypothetical protein
LLLTVTTGCFASHSKNRVTPITSAAGGADDTTPSAHIAPYLPSAAKRPTAAPMIVETFFLMEEKRAIRTLFFQDLFGT